MDNIFILGTRRSGSTFLGNLVYKSFPKFSYIEEPFNAVSGLKSLPYIWYPYHKIKYDSFVQKVSDQKPINFKRAIVNSKTQKPIINANLIDSIKEVFKNESGETLTKRLLRVPFKSKHNISYYKSLFFNYDVNIVKDPLASLLVKKILDNKKNGAIFIYRNPVAFYHSINRLNWRILTENFINQKDLIDDYPFIKDLPEINKIDHIINEWLIVNTILLEHLKSFENIICVSHENLSKNPKAELLRIRKKMKLNLAIDFKEIEILTSAKTPHNGTKDIKRNSLKELQKWKGELKEAEVTHIKKRTSELYSQLELYAI